MGATVVVMAVVAFVVFSLLYLTPGDPAAVIAGLKVVQVVPELAEVHVLPVCAKVVFVTVAPLA